MIFYRKTATNFILIVIHTFLMHFYRIERKTEKINTGSSPKFKNIIEVLKN